jgi:hypothetical protein
MAMSEPGPYPDDDPEWRLGCHLTTNHVWDAFIILSLLEAHQEAGELLQVSHKGLQEVRFHDAMAKRNKEIIEYGQPNAVCHVCDKCMRIYQDEDGNFRECILLNFGTF